jgi:DNA-binding MarR family transcriptional regulator
MVNIFQKINTTRKNLKTYKVGLLQAKVYRKLVNETNIALKPYGITSTDWAFLGILFESSSPVNFGEVKDILEVKAPFVTEIVNRFKDKGLIELTKDENDSRIKLLNITIKGKLLVDQIEEILRARSKKMLSGLNINEIINYVHVLDKISETKF